MINGLARSHGHETCFIHEGFHLHVSESLAPVMGSAGCWCTQRAQYHSSSYVGFTLRNVNTGTERNRLHNALHNHHYAPTSVTQWLQIYHSVLLNITTVRYWTCWRSPGSESPLNKPKPWRTFTLLPLKTVITGSCLILARLLEPKHTFFGGGGLIYMRSALQLSFN